LSILGWRALSLAAPLDEPFQRLLATFHWLDAVAWILRQ